MRLKTIMCISICWVLCFGCMHAQYVAYEPLYPLDGSKFVNPHTNIIINASGNEPVPPNFVIEDSQQNTYTYTQKQYENRYLLFPDMPLPTEERICVSGKDMVTYCFTTSKRAQIQADDNELLITPKQNTGVEELPELDINILPGASTDFLFFHTRIGDVYSMVMDSTGAMYHAQLHPQLIFDFKVLRNGQIAYSNMNLNEYHVMNKNFVVVDTLKCQNGYESNHHELQVLENGHAFLMAYDQQVVDMSEIVEGGSPNATVLGLVIQELNMNDEVVFQWASWDHFEITDAVRVNFTSEAISYVHGNSIDITPDNNMLISSRNMDEITKIDLNTGEIIWRLGGKNNQFTFINDDIQFTGQHDARITDSGTLTLFDNGAHHKVPQARALEYEIDEVNMTATLVWSYALEPIQPSLATGSCQRLDNGNTLINWGILNDTSIPQIVEVDADGNEVMTVAFVQPNYTYRARKSPLSDFGLNTEEIMEYQYENILYPNPSTGLVYLELEDGQNIKEVRVLGLNGQTLFHKYINANQSEMDLSHLQRGVYLVQINSDNGKKETHKLVVTSNH